MYNRDCKDVFQFQSERAQTRRVSRANNRVLLTLILVSTVSLNIMLCNIELGTAIICACLPTYRPLLQRKSGTSVVQPLPHNSHGDARAGYNRFNDDSNSDKIFFANVADGTRTDGNEARFIPLNAISVERRIEVSY